MSALLPRASTCRSPAFVLLRRPWAPAPVALIIRHKARYFGRTIYLPNADDSQLSNGQHVKIHFDPPRETRTLHKRGRLRLYKTERAALSANTLGRSSSVMIVKTDDVEREHREYQDQSDTLDHAQSDTEHPSAGDHLQNAEQSTQDADTIPHENLSYDADDTPGQSEGATATSSVDLLQMVQSRTTPEPETATQIVAELDSMRPSRPPGELKLFLPATQYSQLLNHLTKSFINSQLRACIHLMFDSHRKVSDTLSSDEPSGWLPTYPKALNKYSKTRCAEYILQRAWNVYPTEDVASQKQWTYTKRIGLSAFFKVTRNAANSDNTANTDADSDELAQFQLKWGVEVQCVAHRTSIKGPRHRVLAAAEHLNKTIGSYAQEIIPATVIEHAWTAAAQKGLHFPLLAPHNESHPNSMPNVAAIHHGRDPNQPIQSFRVHGSTSEEPIAAKRTLVPPDVARPATFHALDSQFKRIGPVALGTLRQFGHDIPPFPAAIAPLKDARLVRLASIKSARTSEFEDDAADDTAPGSNESSQGSNVGTEGIDVNEDAGSPVDAPGEQSDSQALFEFLDQRFIDPKVEVSAADELCPLTARTVVAFGSLFRLGSALKYPKEHRPAPMTSYLFWPDCPNVAALIRAMSPTSTYRLRRKLNMRLVPELTGHASSSPAPTVHLKFALDHKKDHPVLQSATVVLDESVHQVALTASATDLELRSNVSRDITALFSHSAYANLQQFVADFQSAFAAGADLSTIPLVPLNFSDDAMPKLLPASQGAMPKYIIADLQVQHNLSFVLPESSNSGRRAFPISYSDVSNDHGATTRSEWSELRVHFDHKGYQKPEEQERRLFAESIRWLIRKMDQVSINRADEVLKRIGPPEKARYKEAVLAGIDLGDSRGLVADMVAPVAVESTSWPTVMKKRPKVTRVDAASEPKKSPTKYRARHKKSKGKDVAHSTAQSVTPPADEAPVTVRGRGIRSESKNGNPANSTSSQ